MKKIISAILLSLCTSLVVNLSYAACTPALPPSDPHFRDSFESAARCYCATKLPAGMCTKMNTIYQRMIGVFFTIQGACKYQAATYPNSVTIQMCVDQWNCYLDTTKCPKK